MEMIFGEKFNQKQISHNSSSMKKISAIINPPKADKNELILKKVISLFYQVDFIEDFDPVSQFDLIENIPVSQQKFCELITQVLFKKTKTLFTLKSNYQSFLKEVKKDVQKLQKLESQVKKQQSQSEFFGNQKSEYIIQNDEKIFCTILTKIRSACSRLQQLIYRMIDIHKWKCQSKNNCSGNYLQGHIAKVLFKKLILPCQFFQRQFGILRSFVQQKQFRCENKNDIEALKYEIQKWGRQLISLIGQQNLNQNSLDQKASSETKYFKCKSCYFGRKQAKLEINEQVAESKPKKKKKKKNINASFQNSSQENSRKDSLLSVEQKSTTDQIEEDNQSTEEKNYSRTYKFLQDLKIDIDNRIEIRLQLDQNDDSEFEYCSGGNNNLRQKIRKILYKSSK